MNIGFIFPKFFHCTQAEGDRHGVSGEQFIYILGGKLRNCIYFFWKECVMLILNETAEHLQLIGLMRSLS